ncbi:hypothetical protein [Corynebacterium sp.]|uniref:hypothetical protein n=1 Tax=Corynebacterium sp. TaxID=1720 RepID=UPI0025BA363C|nr:hypothetical protein [Corynebacterium sp.]
MKELFKSPRAGLSDTLQMDVFPTLTSAHSVTLYPEDARLSMVIIMQICGVIHEGGSVTCQAGDEDYSGYEPGTFDSVPELRFTAPSMEAAEEELMSRIGDLFGQRFSESGDREREIIYGLTGGA